jgi:hypothetical protein
MVPSAQTCVVHCVSQNVGPDQFWQDHALVGVHVKGAGQDSRFTESAIACGSPVSAAASMAGVVGALAVSMLDTATSSASLCTCGLVAGATAQAPTVHAIINLNTLRIMGISIQLIVSAIARMTCDLRFAIAPAVNQHRASQASAARTINLARPDRRSSCSLRDRQCVACDS